MPFSSVGRMIVTLIDSDVSGSIFASAGAEYMKKTELGYFLRTISS